MIVPLLREGAWLKRLSGLPNWHYEQHQLVVVSPHPDDETLAVGGLIADATDRGIDIVVVAVTDGENAYEGATGLGPVRRREQEAALRILGVSPSAIVRLGLPDSDVARQEDKLTAALESLSSANTLIIAPWPGDFHPDHEASGRAARRAAQKTGSGLAYYFFWTWHRGTLKTIENLELCALPITPEQLSRKREALECHQSQLDHVSGEPILPQYLLDPVARPFEVILPQ